MNNFEVLLNEEKTISEKVDKAIKVIVAWFEEKIEEVKDSFEDFKKKVIDKKLVQGKKYLLEMKKRAEKLIKDCKDGIRAAKRKEAKKADEIRKNVMKELKDFKESMMNFFK